MTDIPLPSILVLLHFHLFLVLYFGLSLGDESAISKHGGIEANCSSTKRASGYKELGIIVTTEQFKNVA